MGDKQRTLVLVAVLTGVLLVATACGRSGFQYIESDDSTVFAKIPEEWERLLAAYSTVVVDNERAQHFGGFNAQEKELFERLAESPARALLCTRVGGIHAP